MARMTAFFLSVILLLPVAAKCDEKEDALAKDLAGLKGDWLSPVRVKGDMKFQQTLILQSGKLLEVLTEATGKKAPGDLFRELELMGNSTEDVVLTEVQQKEGKRYIHFVGYKDGRYNGCKYVLEYELSGDNLKLKGRVAGIDLTGVWTRKGKKM